MMRKTSLPLIALVSMILLVSMACSLFGAPSTQPAAETEIAVTTVESQPVAEGVSGFQDARNAIIQIEAVGTFASPEFGEQVISGRGSGFIIDPSGIAVTNNHVVTGSSLLKVWVGGDTTKTYSATILGVSECSDLAVIDIEDEGFPFLTWHEGPIDVGMDIFVAGFPLGDPEFTLTKGIISKARADGQTRFSSVESVVEYDATANPGNSGGPVLDADGKVVAIHYQSNPSARQAFGISESLAREVVDRLRAGENVDSIGVNGEAVSSEDGSLFGIWVSSVQPGSVADEAGIQSGDLLTRLGNLPVADDGTMTSYCDIVRSHEPTDTVPVEVLRLATGEVLEGQLNGRELAVTSTIDTSPEATEAPVETQSGVPGTYVNANASQAGQYYYKTEFDDVSDWFYNLVRGNEAGFSQKANNSKFRVEILDDHTYVYFINKNFIYKNVQLDTRVENLGQNTNYTGLVCRYSDDGWYEANILNTGEFAIYLHDADGFHLLYSGGSNLINMGKEVNEYTFICSGEDLTLGINGEKVKTIPAKTGGYRILREGKAGIVVASENVYPLMVEFDWFTAAVPY
ncbi:MAG: S1C family serine protease [Anaerolineales bacterium]|nr:S1C family serine protease [Anaerolineales bacterium]